MIGIGSKVLVIKDNFHGMNLEGKKGTVASNCFSCNNPKHWEITFKGLEYTLSFYEKDLIEIKT